MKFWFITTVLILVNIKINAQNKQYAIWYFARNGLNFNYSPAIPISNPITNNGGNTAVLCDKNGVLKYYYNKNNIYDINGHVIENGTFDYNDSGGVNIIRFNQFLNLGYKSIFFYVEESSIRYSIIDDLANFGQGVVLENKKDILFFKLDTSDIMRGFYIVRSTDCNKFWLLVRKSVNTLIYTMNDSIDIKFSHEIPAKLKLNASNAYQRFKFSQSGNMCAIAEQSKIETGYFDRTTGTIELQSVHSLSGYPFGYEFSSDDRFFYYIEGNKLYQVPIINYVLDWQNEVLIATLLKSGAYDAQHGIDNKIYISYFWCNQLSVIQNPNNQNIECNFQENVITLPFTQMGTRFPIFPILQTTCSDYFIKLDNYCTENLTQFSISDTTNIQSTLWQFGDSQTSTELNPTHTYATPGNYTVTLTVTYTNNSTDTITKDIEIYNKPLKPTIEHK